MKKIFTLSLVCFLGLTAAMAAPLAKGTCKSYFPIEKGTKLTYENYSKKDKLESTDVMEVLDIVETAEAMLIKINSTSTDKKGKETYTSEFDYRCEGDKFYVSMESVMDGEMMEAYKDMEVEITQTDLEIPSVMDVGTTLPDANMKMSFIDKTFKSVDWIAENVGSVRSESYSDAGALQSYRVLKSIDK
ncbi:MAG: hypothetical protein ACPG21_07755 [Crocinitomicaceae bacterium]